VFKFKLGSVVYHKIGEMKGMVVYHISGFSGMSYVIVWSDLTSSEHCEEELGTDRESYE